MTPADPNIGTLRGMAGSKGLPGRLLGAIRVRPRVVDVVVAVMLSVLVTLAVETSSHGASLAVALPCALLASTAVAWRRRAPLAAVAATIVGPIGWSLTSAGHSLVGGLPLLLALYTVASRGTSPRQVRQLVVAALGGLGACVAIAAGSGTLSASAVASIALPLVVGPAVAGYLVARQRSIAGSLRTAVEELHAEEEARLAAVRVRERNRVARDMHDVVAHGVSAMVVQAGAARTVLDDAPELAEAALEEVVRTGGVALADLGRIVGTLNAPGTVQEGVHIGIDALPALVEARRREGLPVQLLVAGDPHHLVGEADEAVYRLVEESLTNVAKHADAAPTKVSLVYGKEAVRVVVYNDMPAHTQTAMARTGSGLGLIGMRERVETCLGTLVFGPQGDGFVVEAVVPIDAVSAEMLAGEGKVRIAAARLRRTAQRLGPWAGVALALVVLGADVFVSNDRSGPLAINLVLVAAMAVALHWCRRYPLGFLLAVNLLALPLSNGLTAVNKPTVVSTFVFVIPVWAVAVWEDDTRARVGLGLAIAFGAAEGVYWHEAGSVVANVALTVGLWLVGRVVHAQSRSADELERTRARVEQEQRHIEALTLAAERASLVVGLHREVAVTVEGMVRSARDLLDILPAREASSEATAPRSGETSAAIGRIERAGRDALARLREILGILRADLDPVPLSPQWAGSSAEPAGAAATTAAGGAP
jgi:signal transduction histidine kinase